MSLSKYAMGCSVDEDEVDNFKCEVCGSSPDHLSWNKQTDEWECDKCHEPNKEGE